MIHVMYAVITARTARLFVKYLFILARTASRVRIPTSCQMFTYSKTISQGENGKTAPLNGLKSLFTCIPHFVICSVVAPFATCKELSGSFYCYVLTWRERKRVQLLTSISQAVSCSQVSQKLSAAHKYLTSCQLLTSISQVVSCSQVSHERSAGSYTVAWITTEHSFSDN